MKTTLKSIILIAILALGLNSCVKQEFDVPPSNCDTLNTIEANITIKDLKAMLPVYQDTLKITQDLIISGYVISTDLYGNFYKELVIQDSTGGISILLDQTYLYTMYPQGQRIIVYLKDLYLGHQYGVVKLGATYDDNGVIKFGRIQGQEVIDMHLVKTCENTPQEPKTITLDQVNDDLLYTYVKIDPAQFSESELGTTWANPFADPPQAVNHTLIDSKGNSIIVRTSGYATFAGEPIPEGSGPFVAILGKYNSDYQLYVNSPSEVELTNARFATPVNINKDFSDASLTSGGWQNINASGAVDWTVSTKYGNPAPGATISNWNGSGHDACVTWFVSPSMDLTASTSPVFSFDNAHGYSGDWLQVYYSTDWDGDPATLSTATWTEVNFNSDQSTDYFVWANSGEIALPSEQNVHIAFKYTGSSTDGMTWELDNIKVYDKGKK